MANANAIVEKMATVGLRHGEKAGVAIAMTVFLVCVASAVQRKGSETTPEQVKKAAELSQQNLNRHEDPASILKKLQDDGTIKPTHFAGDVEQQIQVKLVADQYKPSRTWVSPEPGAGLIRDMPDLIAPYDLFAYPGRGGVLVFALDEEGKKIPLKPGEEKESAPQKYGKIRKKKRGGMGGSMGGMMGGQRKKKKRKKSKAEIAREQKAEHERLNRQLQGELVGAVSETSKSEDEDKDEDEGGPFKEVTKGYRWVAITGLLDHAKVLENYRKALKNPAVAQPQYMRLDLQRRLQQADGTWSDWEIVDAEKNYDVLDNVTDQEEELAPETVLPDGLVDRLPFLTAGLWEKVHIASLVPKEKRKLPDLPKSGGKGMMMGMGGSGMAAAMQMQGGRQGMMMPNMGKMGSMGMAMGGSGMSMGGGENESAGDYWKTEAKKVMIRALDFTVNPDETYRYRVRIVVANPNYNRDDINAGVDHTSKYLMGPWSKETGVVSMPPDVQPYAIGILPTPKSGTRMLLQVIRFNPGDGWTIPHGFDVGVGEVIGESYREAVPKSDGSGTRKELIDFNAHQIVIDVEGGDYQNLPSGMIGPSIQRPAVTALLRPDGAMAIHSQADDLADQFRKDIAANYKHELDQSNKKKKRKHSQGSGYSSMMGGGRGR